MSNKNKTREIVKVEKFTTHFLKSLFGNGRLATVNFTKKSTGENRTLNGKALVHKALAGGEAAYDAESRGQVRVVDVNIYKDRKGNAIPRTSEFRAVVVDNINWVTANGKKYIATGEITPQQAFVQNVSHNSVNGLLRVTLNGATYVYFGVPREIFHGFIDAENKGAYFNQNIKNKFTYNKVS